MAEITVKKPVILNTNDWLKHTTMSISVRMSKPLTIRLWLGMRVLRVGAWLIGGRAELEQGK